MVTEDGKAIYQLTGTAKYGVFKARTVDIATGKLTNIGEARMKQVRGNGCGLVPGGKYLYVNKPGMYILDRRTLKVVASKAFRKTDVLGVAFNADGSRYAVVTGGLIYVDRKLRESDPHTWSVVRIMETRSGKTLWAFFPSTRWVAVKFAPDGKRLAVINDDDTIELWILPAAGGK